MESLFNMTVESDKSGLQVLHLLLYKPLHVYLCNNVLLWSLTLTWMCQVAIHAIGDRANDLILDMYKSVVAKNGMRDRRFRVNNISKIFRNLSNINHGRRYSAA